MNRQEEIDKIEKILAERNGYMQSVAECLVDNGIRSKEGFEEDK